MQMKAYAIYNRCNKPSCHCRSGERHGPYWYGFAYVLDPKTGHRTKRVKFKYWGLRQPSDREVLEEWRKYEARESAAREAREAAAREAAAREAAAREAAARESERKKAAGGERFTYTRMSRAVALRVLGLDEGCTRAEVKRAARALTLKHHPDQFDRASAAVRERKTAILKAVNAAADYLGRR